MPKAAHILPPAITRRSLTMRSADGGFCARQKIHPKIFCGEVDAGAPPKSQESVPRLTDLTDEQMNTLVERNYQKIRQDVADFLQFELNNPDV